jgi:hypothetical protein
LSGSTDFNMDGKHLLYASFVFVASMWTIGSCTFRPTVQLRTHVWNIPLQIPIDPVMVSTGWSVDLPPSPET